MAELFEQWASREIHRLRNEADVLQLACDRYLASQGGKVRTVTGALTAASTANAAGQRRSKYESLFVAWANASREHPISYDDMEQVAREVGSPISRDILRSTLFAQKRIGRVKAVDHGFVWIVEQTETAPTQEGDAVS